MEAESDVVEDEEAAEAVVEMRSRRSSELTRNSWADMFSDGGVRTEIKRNFLRIELIDRTEEMK